MTQNAVESGALYRDAQQPVDKRVEDLLARMSLEEKLAQIGSVWIAPYFENGILAEEKVEPLLRHGIGQLSRLGGGSTMGPTDTARCANQAQEFLVKKTRLGIPAMLHDECCSGYMAAGATTFPQAIGLASTWDPELVTQMTAAIRTQMRAVGVHQGLAPVLDVARDPRWGRVEETFGEDPYLIASIGAAYVHGLQGDDLRQGVVATGKHFAGHGASQGGMNWAPAHIPAREFREVYLAPFEAAIKESHLASIMNAYHEIDGVACGGSHELLTEILRTQWGFDGIVGSDYQAVAWLADYHHLAADKSEAAVLALSAGLDVELPNTDCYGAPLAEAIEKGKLPLSVLDESVRRVLRLKFRLGLFENPYVDADAAPAVFDTAGQRAVARRLAQESIVLLKNEDHILPLKRDLRSLAVIGPGADSLRYMVGDYSYLALIDFTHQNEKLPLMGDAQHPGAIPQSLTILEAIKGHVSPATEVRYAPGCGVLDESRAGFEEAVAIAGDADVALLIMGGKSGLSLDCTCGELRDRAELGLPGVQEELVRAVQATGTPLIVVILDGRPLSIPWIAEHAQALLEAWLPGEEGGPALADVLFGRYNPGGRLPATFPRAVGQVPIFCAQKPSGGQSFNFIDYVELSAQPLFPFGYGLSYTQFEYGNLRISPEQTPADGRVQISVDVKNVGERAGDEVVQLYVRDVVASLTRPVKELRGFRRLRLEPGEQKTVTFSLAAAQLAFYDLQMAYVVEPGTVEVMVGASSADIRASGRFEIVGDTTPITRKVFFSDVQVG